jgi:2-methylcitrate dehydratase
VNHLGDPTKKYPKNRENADHSAAFLVSVTLLKGDLKEEHFTDAMYSDPKIRALTDKVRFEIASELNDPKAYPAAEVQIKTRDGQTHTHKSFYHRGHPQNPMTDAEVEAKFLELASRVIGADKAKQVSKATYQLEKLTRVSELTALF